MYYLATPYSNYPGGHDAAADAADREAGFLIKHGINAMSPIAHCHRIFKSGYATGGDFETWKRWNFAMLYAAKGLIVCKLDGWAESKGVQAEIKIAQGLDMKVIYMEPGVLPMELA